MRKRVIIQTAPAVRRRPRGRPTRNSASAARYPSGPGPCEPRPAPIAETPWPLPRLPAILRNAQGFIAHPHRPSAYTEGSRLANSSSIQSYPEGSVTGVRRDELDNHMAKVGPRYLASDGLQPPERVNRHRLPILPCQALTPGGGSGQASYTALDQTVPTPPRTRPRGGAGLALQRDLRDLRDQWAWSESLAVRRWFGLSPSEGRGRR
jgi:hypothetical protein